VVIINIDRKKYASPSIVLIILNGIAVNNLCQLWWFSFDKSRNLLIYDSVEKQRREEFIRAFIVECFFSI